MLTDGPATPVRLEVLLDLLKKLNSGLKRTEVYNLLQPGPLLDGSQNTAKDTLSAALQLGLAEETSGIIKLSKDYKAEKSVKENILRAADVIVLSKSEVEFHLSLFYAYFLGLSKEVYARVDYKREDWANQFNKDVFRNEPQTNPFNATKYTGLDRWFSYLGLGWYDSNENFQANPYERLQRALPIIFDGEQILEGEKFMTKLSEVCPELDGGEIFLKANEYRNYNPEDKHCTLGLSHALIDLHENGTIRLICPLDSRGWNIGITQPSRDDSLVDDRITKIELIGKE